MSILGIKQVLWDIPEEQIDSLEPEFLIRRALSYGTVSLMLSLKKEYGVPLMRSVFSQMKQESMSPRRHSFAEKVLLL